MVKSRSNIVLLFLYQTIFRRLKRLPFLLTCLTLLFSLSACQNPSYQPTKTSLFVFGTTVDIAVYDTEPQIAEKAISDGQQSLNFEEANMLYKNVKQVLEVRDSLM